MLTTDGGVAWRWERTQCGAEVGGQDDRGMTPLHTAVAKNEVEMAELLVHFGANLSQEDHTGVTCLQRAMEGGKERLLQRMLAGHARQLHEIQPNNPTPHAQRLPRMVRLPNPTVLCCAVW